CSSDLAVFASPTALQVLEATKAADAGRGVVQIVKNYTGDVLNFRIAGEISGDDAVETEMVLVDDDLATDTADGGGPGRRGTAATVIVEKLCGAAAEAGASLAEVAAIGRRAAGRARTMSLALSAGTHPGDSEPQFTLGVDEVELGVGIHGERGRDRVPFRDADGLTALLLEPLRAELELHRGDQVLAIVTGLGGAYPLELNLVARSLHHHLAEARVASERHAGRPIRGAPARRCGRAVQATTAGAPDSLGSLSAPAVPGYCGPSARSAVKLVAPRLRAE